MIDDLMVGSRVETTAKHMGLGVRYAHDPEAFWSALREGPALVLLATDHTQLPWESLLRESTRTYASVPVLAFGSHLNSGTRQRARQAGVTRWVANSRIAEALPQLIAELGPRAE